MSISADEEMDTTLIRNNIEERLKVLNDALSFLGRANLAPSMSEWVRDLIKSGEDLGNITISMLDIIDRQNKAIDLLRKEKGQRGDSP